MKKKCTNSTCRRVFSLHDAPLRCPHCGQAYPRLRKGAFCRVVLCALSNDVVRVRAIRHYRNTVERLLPSQCRSLLLACGETPVCVGVFRPNQAAHVQKEWQELGFRAELR